MKVARHLRHVGLPQGVEADTIDEAVRLHEGEARTIREVYEALPKADRAALLAFPGTL